KNPVAIAEGPKQAIYGTLYFGLPDNPKPPIWVATFHVSSLNAEICRPLAGRNVTLYPHLSLGGKTYSDWCDKAKEIQKRVPGLAIQVSDLLERLATDEERKSGNDLADYLINHDWRAYRERKGIVPTPTQLDQKPSQARPITTKTPASNPLQTLSNPPLPNLSNSPENGELYTFSNFSDDRKQNAGLQDNTPVAAINRIQSHQSQTMTVQTSRSFEAFTNPQNELLIQNPMDPERFTVYPDIESYNHRSVLPKSRSRNE